MEKRANSYLLFLGNNLPITFMRRKSHKILCRACDLVVKVPVFHKGYNCICPQCKSHLRSGRRSSIKDVAIVSIASVILLFTLINLPYMTISAMGVSQSMSLSSIFYILRQDWLSLLYICILFTFFCPLVMHLVVIGIAFFNLKVNRTIANLYMFCYQFCMVDVFIFGILISLVKLLALAQVEFHLGFYCSLVFAILVVWCYSRCSPSRIWDEYYENYSVVNQSQEGKRGIEQGLILCSHCGLVYKDPYFKINSDSSADTLTKSWKHLRPSISKLCSKEQLSHEVECPRCGHHNHYRKSLCFQKTIALLISALIMYAPSNIYPIMYTEYLGSSLGSNIIDGVISLWGMHSYFVAIVILIASICIPVIKILCIFCLVFLSCDKTPAISNPAKYNRLYKIVLFIGRWSMIDVFVVIVMSTVVRMSGLLSISPGIAIICFSMVVLITMVAAEEYDERLLWDKFFAQRVVQQYQALVKLQGKQNSSKASQQQENITTKDNITHLASKNSSGQESIEQPKPKEVLAKE